MRNIAHLNISQSIRKQKLVFPEKLFDKFERLAVYFFSLVMICFSIGILISEFSANDQFIKYLAPFPLLFAVYIIYRKATEKELYRITTNISKEDSREMLLELANRKGLEIYRQSKECLVFNEQNGFTDSYHKKSLILLLENNEIYFTMIQDRYRLSTPTLISHIIWKNELKKMFSEKLASR